MTRSELHEFIASSTGNEKNICQIHAIKDEKTVFDDCWHGYTADNTVNVMSVTKGVMAILTGIAMDKGLITSLEHLLTMTAPYKYRSEPWTKVCTSDDWTKAALDLLGGRAGITGEFKYATLGIQILAGIIESSTGMSCLDFANEYLFKPLGIPEHIPHGDSSKEDQFEYLMSKAPRKNEWYSEPGGTVTAGWGLALSAKDMSKIGWMLLNDGVYEGKSILSGDWINRMTSPIIRLGEDFGNMYYGYLWYRPNKLKSVFAAIGDGGNVIYANPEKNISVGVSGAAWWFFRHKRLI